MTLDLDTYNSVKNLVQEVEESSGKGVEFIFQPLQETVLGNLKTARGEATHHLILLNSKYTDIRHAVASYQLRMILGRCRIKTPEKDLTANDLAISEVFAGAQARLGVAQARQLASMVVSGAVIQLMSVAPGLRAQLDISKHQQDLQAQHKRAMVVMAENNIKNLAVPQLPIPGKYAKWAKVLMAIENLGMALMTDTPELVVPFQALGLVKEAETVALPLLEGKYDSLDNREIIDLTAKAIGMSGIHRWVKA